MDGKIAIRNAEMGDIPKLVEFRIKLQEHMENANDLILRYNDRWKATLHEFYKKKINDPTSSVFVAQNVVNR